MLLPQCISVVLTSVFAQVRARNWTWQLWIHSTSSVAQFNKACAGAFSLSPNSFFHAFRQCDLRLEDTHRFSGGDTVKNKHRLTDAQTYVGLPSTSVTVRCFFMSACFTVMSLSSGLTSSRLQRNAKLFISLFLFSCHNENSVVAETRTVFWTSCRFTSVQLQLSGSQPLQRHPPIQKNNTKKTTKKKTGFNLFSLPAASSQSAFSTQEPHKKEKEKLLA